MQPSAKSLLRFGATICCLMVIGAFSMAADNGAAAGPFGPMIAMEQGRGPVVASARHGRFEASRALRRAARHPRRRAFRRFRPSQSFGWGYGYLPLLSGPFETEPPEGVEGGSEVLPPGFYPMPPAPPPQCVTPLVIELEPQKTAGKTPRVTYGAPAFCPPPQTISAPPPSLAKSKRSSERRASRRWRRHWTH